MTARILSNRHLVWALLFGAAFAGIRAYRSIPMQLFPDTAPPLVNVITPYPGAGARDVDENLSQKLEAEFASLEGVVNIRATSQDNLSRVSVEFAYHRPVELAALDVQNAISRIRNRLPSGIGEPQVLRFSTSDRPVITIGIRSDDLTGTRRLAMEELVPAFARIPGVAAVDVSGGHVPAILVQLDREQLERTGLTLAQVSRELTENNVSLPAGILRTERTTSTFRLEMRVTSLEGLRRFPLTLPGGGHVRLGDIASVDAGALPSDARYSVNGTDAIAIQIMKTTEGNTVSVVQAVERELENLRLSYPDQEFIIAEESASFTKTSLANLFSNIRSALLFAGVLIFLFLSRWKLALVAIISMPLSYALTFALMQAFGIEFNMVTLTAVILAVGMVVDATVVMLENIVRIRDELGLEPARAAIEGSREVLVPVLAGTATTLMVLVPMLFLDGFIGKTFSPLAATLLFAFTSSVLVALVLVPVLTLYTHGASRLDRFSLWISFPFLWLMDQFRKGTLRVLKLALRQRVLTILLVLALFVVSLRGLARQGMEMMPRMDSGALFITLRTPSGSSLDETMRRVRQFEEILLQEPHVRMVSSQAGFESGMRTFAAGGIQNATAGFISVSLVDRTDRDEDLWSFMNRMRHAFATVPGVREFSVREQGNTSKSTTSAPIVLRVSGDNATVLYQLGLEIRERIRDIPGLLEVQLSWHPDEEQNRLLLDRFRAGELGLGADSVARQLASAINGMTIGEFTGSKIPEPIVLQLHPGESTLSSTLDIPLGSSSTRTRVPARFLVSPETFPDRGLFTREGQRPVLEITAGLQGRPLNQAVMEVQKATASVRLPAGYDLRLTGENADMKEARREMLDALLLALAGVYLILVAQLRSWLYPVIIMFSIPLSLVGVSAALRIAGKPISMPVLVGLILLVGTVVNNAILLHEFYRTNKEQMERRQALLMAVSARFRPIMMTSVSTVVGMIPLAGEWALGAERFSPLATAVMGGLTASTILTLVFIPVLTDLADSVLQKTKAPNTDCADQPQG